MNTPKILAGKTTLIPTARFSLPTGAAVVLVLAGAGLYLLLRSEASVPALADPAVRPCGIYNMASVTSPTAPAPVNPVTKFAGGSGVGEMRIFRSPSGPGADKMVVQFVNSFQVYNMSDGTAAGSFSLPFESMSGFGLDEQGNIYVARNPSYGQTIHKLSMSGQEIWNKPAGVIASSGMFSFKSADGQYRIGVMVRGQNGSRLFNTSGDFANDSPIIGSKFTQDPSSGKILATDNSYVRTYANDAANTKLGQFGGDNPDPNAPGFFRFYQPGAAILAPNGMIYIPDGGLGMVSASQDGFYKNKVPVTSLGDPTQSSPAEIYNGRLYFANGGKFNSTQKVSSISLTDLEALLAYPHAPDPVLGFGAGLISPAKANYFKPGETPAVNVSFDPVWGAVSGLSGRYTVREYKQVVANQSVAAQSFSIPTGASTTQINVPLSGLPARPGFYEVEATLTKNNEVIGADCLYYSVGAPGNTLDMNTLPAGAGHGGPSPTRGLELSRVLGLKVFRAGISNVDWEQLLPGGADSTAPMVFPAYLDDAFRAAAAHPAAADVTLVVQIGEGGGVPAGLVANGKWQARVQELVNHYKPWIHAWEAWNEPNNTYASGDPARYSNDILEPFVAGVKAADPTALTVGGSVLGVNANYFDGIGAAGGLNAVDVISVHSYTGHGRGYEEEGTGMALEAVRTVFKKYNVDSKPFWDTESGFWNEGPHNQYNQARNVVRKIALLNTAGVSKYAYFYTEGGFQDPYSYAMIQYVGAREHFVNPSALGAMVLKTQIGNRPFSKLLPTNAPHIYAALYGSPSDGMIMLWTENTNAVDVSVGLPGVSIAAVNVVDMLGDTSSVPFSNGVAKLSIDGSPRYITFSASAEPTVASSEGYGVNLALASGGATATATSNSSAAAKAIDGVAHANNNGNPYGYSWSPAWSSASGDTAPVLTIKLPRAESINRILVSSHSVASVVTGLRNYDVQVLNSGSWETVASVTNEFFSHRRLITFEPRTTDSIRVVVKAVNYGGIVGGSKPWYSTTTDNYPGLAVIYEVEVYKPGGATSTPPPPVYGALANTSFESPDLATGQHQVPGAAGYGWVYQSNAGIAENGSGYTSGNPAAPEGTQVAVLQMNGIISQPVALEAGKTYSVTFSAAQRANYQATAQNFEVQLGDKVLGTFQPAGTAYADYTAGSFSPATSGSYELKFRGLNTIGGVDNTAFLDNIRLTANTGTSADTTAPSTAITQPTAGSTATGTITLKATASDNVGVTKLEFYDGTALINATATLVSGTAQNGTWQASWNTAAVPNGSHTLTAKAYDAANNGPGASGPVSVTVNNDTTPPSAPANLTAKATSPTQVDLAWSASTDNVGVVSYRIYRNDNTLAHIATVSTTSYSDTSVSSSTTYSYWVKAVDAAGNTSDFSSTASVTTPAPADTTKPTAPTLTGSTTSTAINLSWTASTDASGIARYYVYRNGVVIADKPAGTLNHSDTTATPGTSYSYTVRAVDNANNYSDSSNTVSATIPAPTSTDTIPPSAPANLTANIVGPHQVNLGWTASTDNVKVAHYDIYRNNIKIGSSATTSFGDGTVSPNTSYAYKVVAVDTSGNQSAASNTVTITGTNKKK